MTARRSSRSPALLSPLALLDEVEPARRAITAAMATVNPTGEHYAALERAMAALDRLAADLGHAGRYAARAPGR